MYESAMFKSIKFEAMEYVSIRQCYRTLDGSFEVFLKLSILVIVRVPIQGRQHLGI